MSPRTYSLAVQARRRPGAAAAARRRRGRAARRAARPARRADPGRRLRRRSRPATARARTRRRAAPGPSATASSWRWRTRALERDMPVLGICRGMQLLNVACGGTLVQHLPDVVGHDEHRHTPGRVRRPRGARSEGTLAARAVGARDGRRQVAPPPGRRRARRGADRRSAGRPRTTSSRRSSCPTSPTRWACCGTRRRTSART